MQNTLICCLLALAVASTTSMAETASAKAFTSVANTVAPTTVDAKKAEEKTQEKPSVFILEPANGATVPATFTVKFGAKNVVIVPAGTAQENSGHHHLLIDLNELPNMKMPLPANSSIMHFGKAQTETQLTLKPGKHTLQLLLGDHVHIPGENPVLSEKITVIVKEASAQ